MVRAFKMVYRKESQLLNSSFVENSLADLHKEQIFQAYNKILGDPDMTTGLDLKGLKDLSYLFGQEFETDEWLICYKETKRNLKELVYIDKLVSYLEKIGEETKLDPFNVIREVIIKNELYTEQKDNPVVTLKFMK